MNKKVCFYISIILICLCGVYAGLADLDFYWQSDLGESIVKNFDFYHIYSSVWGTKGLGEYLDHEWLCNILFYFLSLVPYRPIAFAKLLVCTITGVQFVRFIKSEKRDYTFCQMILIFLFILFYATVFCKIKAYTLSLVLFMQEIVVLRQFSRESAVKNGLKLIAIAFIWFNFHSGSALIFFGILGVYWLTEYRHMSLVYTGIVSLLATLANPYGIRLWFFNIAHFFDKNMKIIIRDWDGLDMSEPLGIMLLCMCLSCIGVVAVHWRECKFEFVLVLVFTYLSFSSMRHGIYMIPLAVLMVGYIGLPDFNINMIYSVIGTGFLLLLILFDVFVGNGYNETYDASYVSNELIEAVKKYDNDGLFSDSSYLYLGRYGIKDFSTGAYPLNAARVQDTKTLTSYGGELAIKNIIDYYELDKFLFCKWNTEIEYYSITNPLYDYLSARENEYELIYDSDMLVFFVRR